MEEERARAQLGAERQRLKAFPLADLAVDEEAAREQTERPFAEAVERAGDGEDHPGRDPALLDAARLGPSREPFQALRDPAVQDNSLVEDDETTFDDPPPERDPAMPVVPDGTAEDDTGRIQPLPRRCSLEQVRHRAMFRPGSAPVMVLVLPRRRRAGSG